MVLDHVPKRAGFLIVSASSFDANRFGGCDLYVVHIAAIPQRLKNTIAETKRQNILDSLLAQVMIDAEHLVFVEHTMDRVVEFSGTLQVVPERLFDDNSSPAGISMDSCLSDSVDDRDVLTRLRRKIEQNVP